MTQTDSGGQTGAGGATGAAAASQAAGSASPEAAAGGQARVPSERAPEPSAAPREELRLAVVLNGGVSLAVWMGGASLELHRLAQGAGVYGALLQLAGCRARIDVIAGTSAGGINGAALALAQANRKARLADLRDIWTDQGQIDTLLRRPFRGSPTSLLQGDEYFLPRLNEAMQRLVTPFEGTSPEDHPLDLTITTTLLRGAQKVSVDSSGQRLPQWVHEGRFRFARSGTSTEDPFGSARITTTADQLALAARCTASFPVAFEPSFVPVDRGPGAESAEDLLRLRPDMGAVASWASGNRDEPGWVAVDPEARFDVSRFAVDGGLLANMPTRAALDAVDTMEASGPVRRVMLLVHPHAPAEQRETADDPEEPPSLTGSMVSILGALSAQGSRTFAEQVEQHNITAAGRRGTRADILATVDTPARLQSLAGAVFEQYRRLRMWRAGRDVAVFVAPQEGWNTERIRRNARRAQEAWYAARQASGDARQPLPYVPSGVKAQVPNGWGWGVSTAVGVADAAADLLRRLVWVLPHGADYDKVSAARRRVSQLRHDIRGSRVLTDRMWQADPVLRGLEPTQTLFTLRLAWYEWAMLGAPDPQQLRALRSDISDLIDRVAEHEAARVEAGPTAQARSELVRGTLHHRLLGEGAGGSLAAVDAGAIGEQVRSLVDQVVAEVRDVQPLLAGRTSNLHPDLDAELAAWARILGRRNGNGQLLQVLLALEVATTALGDENPTEYSLPLELVQLSAQASNGFATATRTADDKLGGMSISRFGGFLKRSWRLNDWAWGRMDAATVLCRLILEPSRLRRTAGLSGRVGGDIDPEALAEEVLAALIPELFGPLGDEAPPINDFDGLRAAAKAELTEVFSDRPIGDLPPTMPKLAELAAWAVHLRAITEELPALGRAVRADSLAGANPRSNGELLVAEQADLIGRLEELASQAGGGELPPFTTASMHDAVTALRAFDRAGVGRESLREEGTSDQLIRTATSAAAVAATVVDSDDSGLAAVKPVTRSLRGGMLLPYWAVTALTAGGVLSRALALLGLSIGAVLLVLALFGALPAWASGVGAAFGTSALLVAFAYGALRTGTMLHGVVLLSPVIPLLAFAVERVRDGSAETSAAQGVATLLAVVALALGLMVLGSLPAPVLSVYGEIDQAGDRMGIPPVPLDLKGSRLAMAQAGRRVRTVLQMLVRPLGTVAAVGVGAAAIVLAVNTGAWVDLADWVGEHRTQALFAAGAVALVGLLVAWRQGESLRVAFDASEALSREIPVWRFHPVRHPAGVVVGWASLYGVAYLVIAGLLLWDPWDWLDTWWGKALLVTALLFAAVLLLVLPVILPWRAKRRVEHAEEAYVYEQLRLGRAAGLVDIRGLTLTRRGRRLARSIGETIQPDGRGEAALRRANQQRLLRDLVERGQAYRFLVKASSKTAEDWYPSAWGADSTTLTVVEQ
jgi:patatin-related protein